MSKLTELPPPLPRTRERDVVIVIPTVANPEVLIPSFQLLLQHMDGVRASVVVSINPLNPQHGAESSRAVAQLWHEYAPQLVDCNLVLVNNKGPRGFGGAINDGLHAQFGRAIPNAMTTNIGRFVAGLPDDGMVIVFNDDLHATPGWLHHMLAAPKSPIIMDSAEVSDPTLKHRPARSSEAYGAIGLVGPMSNYTAGIQQLNPHAMARFRELNESRLDFAEWWSEQVKTEPVWTTVFLSGFCMGITSWAVDRLVHRDSRQRMEWLFDERFYPAGYEDNDICVRASDMGIRACVATQSWLHHLGSQTFDHEFPEAQRGLAMRGTYYDIWRATRRAKAQPRVVATFRTLITVANDLSQWKAALTNVARVADGVAILLTGNPADAMQHASWAQEQRGLLPEDLEMLQVCASATSAQAICGAVERWAAHILIRVTAEHNMPTRVDAVRVWSWEGAFNERDERNALLEHAMDLKPDWILAVDSDEAVELRWTRAHMDRIMAHPDPMVDSFAVRFLTHWDTTRLVNNSKPWGDGGDYTGGMTGFRFFRVVKAAPRAILAGGHNGLHCGNIPQSDAMCKRATGFRMRHYGYLREQDRRRKLARYEQQDPNPNAMLIGGQNYGHIVHEEGMCMQPYLADNGVGLVVLLYSRENPNDLGRLLDHVYTVVDRIVLVWTDQWEDEDKAWAPLQPARFCATKDTVPTRFPQQTEDPMRCAPWSTAKDDWPATGPSIELARMAEHFGCEWIHSELDENLGARRNDGLAVLRGSQGMGWALFLDPDETVDMRQAAIISRLAEVTDAMGWLFRFRNPYADSEGSQSEGIRMCRLNPVEQDQMMVWHGRVHESMEPSARRLKSAGFSNVIRVAPFALTNTGLTGGHASMQRKFDRYFKWSMLELQDGYGPMSHVAWQTIGLYFANEGAPLAAMEAFNRAVMCNGDAYMPSMLLGHAHVRFARQLLDEAMRRAQGSAIGRALKEQADVLDQIAPAMVLHGAARDRSIRPLLTEAEAFSIIAGLPEVPLPQLQAPPGEVEPAAE